MEHIAIMKPSWGLTQKILSGEKKIESRWYKHKQPPWNEIKKGDTIYFKDSGKPVTVRAEVEDAIQFPDLTQDKVKDILHKYGKLDGIGKEKIPEFFEIFKEKKYCILVFLCNVQKVEAFDIDKSGFGSMSAWITVDDVDKIKRKI